MLFLKRLKWDKSWDLKKLDFLLKKGKTFDPAKQKQQVGEQTALSDVQSQPILRLRALRLRLERQPKAATKESLFYLG